MQTPPLICGAGRVVDAALVECGILVMGTSGVGGRPLRLLVIVDELLNREIFYTLTGAKVLIERWRHEYNTVRPHSSLGYFSIGAAMRLPYSVQLPS